jgi:hypothetical protein
MHECAKDIASCLMHSFHDGIGLRISAGSRDTCDSQIFKQLLGLPANELSSIVLHTMHWTGISSDPQQEELGGYVFRRLFLNLNDFREVGNRVNRS